MEEYGKAKGFVYEGGIRVPMIATWPAKIKAGSKTNHISAHYDVLATISDITGFQKPELTDGISFLPALMSNVEKQQKHDFLFWEYPEYGGQVAIRMGDWKVVRQNLNNNKKSTLELYNLSKDPQEKNNVASEHPEIIKRAANIFKKEHTDAEIDKFRIPLIEEGLLSDKPI